MQDNSDIQKMFNSACIICFRSFGVQEQRAPYKCKNKNCNRNYCARCLNSIKNYNGPERSFHCMICLLEYPKGTAPTENMPLIWKLWDRVVVKYGFHQRSNSASEIMSQRDLQFEIECRHYHLRHLLNTLERFTNWDNADSAFTEKNSAYGMVTQLANILTRVRENTAANDPLCQIDYYRMITRPNHRVGSFYINLCECLSAEITDAELRCLFPTIHTKSIEWNYIHNSTDEFQPKIHELFSAIKHDVGSFSSNTYYATLRTKIGFIGYTSSGKTTLMRRLLEMYAPERDEFFLVRTTKSTYCPLEYDCDTPLISSDDHRTATSIKFIDIQGCDRGNNIYSDVIEAGNYLDEIRKVDCDIYVVVFNEDLDHDQHQWISYIKKVMQRQCVLVRSKADIAFSEKFRENCGICYGISSPEEQTAHSQKTINNLRRDFTIEGYNVYLTAACYYPTSSDAALLLQHQSFDIEPLLGELSRLAPLTRNIRVQNLATRAVSHIINSCFRTGYVLNILKYKIIAGVTSPFPFVDRITRHFANENVKEAFGITEDFLQNLNQRQPLIIDRKLQTSAFQPYITVSATSRHSFNEYIDTLQSVNYTPQSIVVNIRSVSETKEHIFGYINWLCNDLIILSISLIESIMPE